MGEKMKPNMKKNQHENMIAVNGLFFASYKILNVLFPLVTSVYVARVLLPAGTGKVAYAQNIVTYFTLIAALGLPTYGTREIARSLNDKSKYYKTFWELFTINALSTTLCVVCYYSLCFLIPSFQSERLLHIVAGFSIILNYFNIDWLYQGREEYKYISIRGVIIKFLSVLILFFTVKDASDYVLYAGIQSIVLGGNNLVNMVGLKRRVGIPKTKLEIKKHIKPLLILFATSIAIELYTLLDTTMLGSLCADEIVGYYSYAMKTTKIVITVLAAMTTVMLPKLSEYYARKDKDAYMKLADNGLVFVLSASIPCAVILFANADLIIQFLYGVEYMGAHQAMMILSLLVVPISLSTFLGTQILCSSNHEKNMLMAVSAGAVTNVILNSFLIRLYQHNGASIASVISECVVALIEIIFVIRIVGLHFDRKVIFTALTGGIGVFLAINLVRLVITPVFWGLLFSSLLGICVYVIIFFILEKEIVLDLIHNKK